MKEAHNTYKFNNLYALDRLRILKKEMDQIMHARNGLQRKFKFIIDSLDEKEISSYQYENLHQKSEKLTSVLAEQNSLLNKINKLNKVFSEIKLELGN